jgi:hypothetical protein
MVKCDKCGENIKEIFLGKIKGTYEKGKAICSDCQKKK